MSGHILRVTVNGGVVELAIECHAAVGAPCRYVCHDCPEPASDHHEMGVELHNLGDLGECNWLLWATNDDADLAELHRAGGPEPLADGMAVTVGWYNDGPFWRAAPAAPTGLDAEITRLSGRYTYDFGRGSNHNRVVDLVTDDLRPYVRAQVDAAYRRLTDALPGGAA